MKLQTVRLIRASVLVGVCAFAFPAMSMAIGQGAAVASGMGDNALPASAGLDACSIDWGRDPYAALDRLEELTAEDSHLPGLFLQESGFPSDAYELHSDASGMVVGCSLDAPRNEALAAVCDVLAANGWACVPLQGTGGAVFVKQEGRLRWMLVTCLQIGDSTSVVYRIGHGEPEEE